MKQWITVDAFIVAFISAVAYGLGYIIPSFLGLSGILCLVICWGVGLAVEYVAEKIMYSRFTQGRLSRKLVIFATFIAVYLIFNIISKRFFGESLVSSLAEEFGYVVAFAVFGFVFSLCKYYYKTNKVKSRYGDGEEGFRFNADEVEYMEGLNRRNAEIFGEYDDSLSVKIRTGVFVGEKEKGVFSFNGIPYAKAPVGELRWKAPEKLPDSDRVFEAKHFGPSAIQVNYEGNPLKYHQQSEDCLYLNVYTTEFSPKDKKPVVVYFHGGDSTYGGSADPLWEMWSFVKKHPEIIAVSFNYRLGFLGFIDLSAVPGGEKCPDSLNLGLLDQIAALTWVKENIEAFGGDPERITVMGDGIGGISIISLAVCEQIKGIFHSAVVFSGSTIWAELNENDSSELALQLLNASGASGIDELLALSEYSLIRLTQELKANITEPRCDGKLVQENIYQAYQSGAAKDISFVLCASRNNADAYGASVGRGFSEDVLSDSIERILRQQTPEIAAKLKILLADEKERVGKERANSKFMNLWMDHIGMLRLAESIQAGGGDLRTLYWDVDAVVKELGSGSVNIVSTVLGNSEAAAAYGNVVNDSVRDVLQALVSKVICGEKPALYPNEVEGVGEISWETYPAILAVTKNEVQLQDVEDTLTDAITLMNVSG